MPAFKPASKLKMLSAKRRSGRALGQRVVLGVKRLAARYPRIRALKPKRAVLKRLKPRALWRGSKKRVARLHRRFRGGAIRGPKTLADNIRYFANPGPAFEPANSINGEHLGSSAKTIAFYLPQFHAFDENDEWWGTGFTEWRNVARGTPRFRGHYQPRVPRDLGFYDLGHLDTIAAQCELAKYNGVDAFCFYYYWFNGQRLMEKPLDLFANSDIDQQFCIMWANENWTRTWDGLEADVLIKQDYLDEDEDDFIADTAKYMADERYVCVNGQPLFILYRPGLLNDPATTIARWRKKWEAKLGITPLVMMVQGFGEEDPRRFGLDGAVEFPPHKVCAGLDNISDRCHFLDSNYQGTVRDYASVVEKSLNEDVPEFPLIKTVSPHWDNDARREGLGMTIHGSTPALYEKWLGGAIDFAQTNPVHGESLVFINAWNEWAEGAYLEPDVHYGHAYLNATKRAVKALPAASDTNRLLLVGHDAHKHGAQMLLLNMAKIYTRSFGMEVVILIKNGGPLLADYQRIAPTYVLSKLGARGLDKLLTQHDFKAAICNTSVTGDVIPELRRNGVKVVSLIHEMPNLIRDYKLESNIQTIAKEANHVVYPADIVKRGFEEFTQSVVANQIIKPQGTYTPVFYDADARDELREELNIDTNARVVVGVGYADLRKGFDLFMDAARRSSRTSEPIHFVWVGALSADMKRWIQADFSTGTGAGNKAPHIHIVGFTDRVKEYYSVADCLFLPSREDPYPTVVLEAMHIGLPVVAFEGTTGFDSLLGELGYLVEYGNNDELDSAINSAVNEPRPKQHVGQQTEQRNEEQIDQLTKHSDESFGEQPSAQNTSIRSRRQEHVNTHCQFDNYCFDLLELLHSNLKRLSVVVPNYNYEQYIEQRMSSIFAQNMPVFEVLFLDDCSTDKSISVLKRVASSANRDVRLVSNAKNSGNVFTQWHRAVQEARGDLIWIAEADDSAAPAFLDYTVSAFRDNTALVFSDSKQIDTDGNHLSKSYQNYLAEHNGQLFSRDFELPSEQFATTAMAVRNPILNVSGVVWNKAMLNQGISDLGAELESYKLVGDWRLYLSLIMQADTSVSYIANALNIHRRHGTSVTASLSASQHVEEIAGLHQFMQENLALDQHTKLAMQAYVQKVSDQLGQDGQDLRRAA